MTALRPISDIEANLASDRKQISRVTVLEVAVAPGADIQRCDHRRCLRYEGVFSESTELSGQRLSRGSALRQEIAGVGIVHRNQPTRHAALRSNPVANPTRVAGIHEALRGL